MTITLAAVYAPIGLQGGLTGTLFREFAFHPRRRGRRLRHRGAHALADDGLASSCARATRIAALPAGSISASRRCAAVIEGALSSTLQFAAGRHHHGDASSCCSACPLCLFTPGELAPTEDQGVILGIIQASPNNTIEQTTRYTEKVNEAFLCVPETKHTFQLTQAFAGFGGMGLKPWSERKRRADQIFGEVAGKVSEYPGRECHRASARPAPRRQ